MTLSKALENCSFTHALLMPRSQREGKCGLPLSETIRSRRLCWVGHVARASPELNHRRVLYATVHDGTGRREEGDRHTRGLAL